MHVCMYLESKFNTFYLYVGFLSYRADGFSVFYVGLIGISFLIRGLPMKSGKLGNMFTCNNRWNWIFTV